jgi:hypothetical protein
MTANPLKADIIARADRRGDACSSCSVTEEYDYARQWMSTFRTSPLHSLE